MKEHDKLHSVLSTSDSSNEPPLVLQITSKDSFTGKGGLSDSFFDVMKVTHAEHHRIAKVLVK